VFQRNSIWRFLEMVPTVQISQARPGDRLLLSAGTEVLVLSKVPVCTVDTEVSIVRCKYQHTFRELFRFPSASATEWATFNFGRGCRNNHDRSRLSAGFQLRSTWHIDLRMRTSAGLSGFTPALRLASHSALRSYFIPGTRLGLPR